MMNMAIQVINVSKSFNQYNVLNNININIGEGSVYGFLGNNGAGKSTLIRIMLGLLNTDSGNILINSKSIKRSDISYKKNRLFN